MQILKVESTLSKPALYVLLNKYLNTYASWRVKVTASIGPLEPSSGARASIENTFLLEVHSICEGLSIVPPSLLSA